MGTRGAIPDRLLDVVDVYVVAERPGVSRSSRDTVPVNATKWRREGCRAGAAHSRSCHGAQRAAVSATGRRLGHLLASVRIVRRRRARASSAFCAAGSGWPGSRNWLRWASSQMTTMLWRSGSERRACLRPRRANFWMVVKMMPPRAGFTQPALRGRGGCRPAPASRATARPAPEDAEELVVGSLRSVTTTGVRLPWPGAASALPPGNIRSSILCRRPSCHTTPPLPRRGRIGLWGSTPKHAFDHRPHWHGTGG